MASLCHIQMCGNYGDPLTVHDLLDIIRYIRSVKHEVNFTINTNASLRTVEWWRELAALTRPRDRVTFAIDGLATTNHLYRRGTDFSKIMQNAAAFIEAGGAAHWEYLLFRHNEHQLDEAQHVAQAMGFKRFTVKRTDRFCASEFRVMDRSGDYAYSIHPTTIETSAKHDPATGPISCNMAQQRAIYISAEGLVFPCCWTGLIYGETRQGAIRNMIEQTGGKDAINAKLHPIDEIIDGAFFRAIMASWPSKSLAVCAAMCSQIPQRFTERDTRYVGQ